MCEFVCVYVCICVHIILHSIFSIQEDRQNTTKPFIGYLHFLFFVLMLFSSLLGTSLVALVIPVSIGMYVNHKWPQKAKIILKVSIPIMGQTSQLSALQSELE